MLILLQSSLMLYTTTKQLERIKSIPSHLPDQLDMIKVYGKFPAVFLVVKQSRKWAERRMNRKGQNIERNADDIMKPVDGAKW